jgi:hypothetical protein
MVEFGEKHLPARNRTVVLTLKDKVDFRVCSPNEAIRRTGANKTKETHKLRE